MTDRYQKIREALAMGPTPGPWVVRYDYVVQARAYEDGRLVPVAQPYGVNCDGTDLFANARLIAACDPDTIRALLDEREALRAEVEAMKRQEPVGWLLDGDFYEVKQMSLYKDNEPLPGQTALYALPGAQPAPSAPEDVMRDAERYRYLRARDEGTAGVGCWIEAEGRACDRGWLYGDQLDSAIDTCIEMLAAAPEDKP